MLETLWDQETPESDASLSVDEVTSAAHHAADAVGTTADVIEGEHHLQNDRTVTDADKLHWIDVWKYTTTDPVPSGSSRAVPSQENRSRLADALDADPDSSEAAGSLTADDEGEANIMRIYQRVPWLSLGVDHPEYLAEAESLASVPLPALDPTLEVRVPLETVEDGNLSNPQLECCIYAARSFSLTLPGNVRGGYFLGEGTGCGKGRIISACIWHLWNQGYRRHVWVSVGHDLIHDAMRDLRDVGAEHIPIVDLSMLSVCDLDSPAGVAECAQRVSRLNPLWKWTNGEGILFATYTLLARSMHAKRLEPRLRGSHQPAAPCAGGHDPTIQHCASSSISSPPYEHQNDQHASSTLPVPCPLKSCTALTVETRLGQVIKWMSRSPRRLSHSPTTKEKRQPFIKRTPFKRKDHWKSNYWSLVPERISPGGLVCFDEAHKAKNLVVSAVDGTGCQTKGTASGQTVQRLQDLLPHCPVLYASATGATELRHMGYMSRLGLWGPHAAFSNFSTFRDTVERGGVATMECVAMDLKSAGLYSCRTLSFADVVVKTWTVTPSLAWITSYNAIAALMADIYAVIQSVPDETTNGSRSSRVVRGGQTTLRSSFWGTQQHIFKQLLVSQKVETAVSLTQDALTRNSQVVISLWGTGESRTNEKLKSLQNHKGTSKLPAATALDDQLDDFLSPPKLMLEQLIKERLPDMDIPQERINSFLHTLDAIPFPNNPLDDLIDKLGGPWRVAELSGRSKRLVWDTTSKTLRYTPRDSGCALESGTAGLTSVNLREHKLFQSGKKKVAVITEAASAGISLHSDASLPHVVPREMICLELPWAADKAVQQLGRIHRSNQVYPPTYHILVSDVGGERRFVACIAKRLKTLGAITRGDRRAATFFKQRGLQPKTTIENDHCDDQETIISNKSDKDDIMTHASSETATCAPSSFLEIDVYSRLGYEARSLLMTWFAHYTDNPTVPLPSIIPTPACVGLPPAPYASAVAFASTIMQLFRTRGIIETSSSVGGKQGSEKHRSREMDRFLNRLLLLPIQQQNEVFAFFIQIHSALVDASRLHGLDDDDERGVECLNVKHGIHQPLSIAERQVLWTDPTSRAETVYFRLSLDRGISWEEAQRLLQKPTSVPDPHVEGFYWLPTTIARHHNAQCVALVLRRPVWSMTHSSPPRVLIYRPHVGVGTTLFGRTTTVATLVQHRWKKVQEPEIEAARTSWTYQYTASYHECLHQQLHGTCTIGQQCRAGRRFSHVHILSGNLVHLWSRLERWFHHDDDADAIVMHEDMDAAAPSRTAAVDTGPTQSSDTLPVLSTKPRLRLIRAMLPGHRTLIGARIPPQKLGILKRNLKLYKLTPEDPTTVLTRGLQTAAARVKMYREDMFFKFIKFIINAAVNCSHRAYSAGMTTDDVYALTLEALDQHRPSSSLWSSDEIESIYAAFPALPSGIDHFDTFLAIGTESIGVIRMYDAHRMRPEYRFRPELLKCAMDTFAQESLRAALERQVETYLYQYYHLAVRKQAVNTDTHPTPPPLTTSQHDAPFRPEYRPEQQPYFTTHLSFLNNAPALPFQHPKFPYGPPVLDAPTLHHQTKHFGTSTTTSAPHNTEAAEIVDLEGDSDSVTPTVFPSVASRPISSGSAAETQIPHERRVSNKRSSKILRKTKKPVNVGPSRGKPATTVNVLDLEESNSDAPQEKPAYDSIPERPTRRDDTNPMADIRRQMWDTLLAVHRRPSFTGVQPTSSTDTAIRDNDPLLRDVEAISSTSSLTAAIHQFFEPALLDRKRALLDASEVPRVAPDCADQKRNRQSSSTFGTYTTNVSHNLLPSYTRISADANSQATERSDSASFQQPLETPVVDINTDTEDECAGEIEQHPTLDVCPSYPDTVAPNADHCSDELLNHQLSLAQPCASLDPGEDSEVNYIELEPADV